MKKYVPALGGGVAADILQGLVKDLPLGNTLAALTGAVLDDLLKDRAQKARTIFIEEIAKAERPFTDVHEADEFAAILYRYLDAARQGAARLNLRLMAKIAKGQLEEEAPKADEFLRYSNMIATVTREEIVYLATLHRHFAAAHGKDGIRVYQAVIDELTGRDRSRSEEVQVTAAAVLRTGLVVPMAFGGIGISTSFSCRPAPLLTRLISLADFEEALRENEPA